MIKNIFFDLDDTLLDFHRGEREAITKTLLRFGVEPDDETVAAYRRFNRSCWEALERGEMTREDVLLRRFELFFAHLGRGCDPREVQHFYERRLAEGYYFVEGAKELLDSLKGRYRLYIASNGTAFVQDRRIAGSGIAEYFDGIFISERLGANKPSEKFFDAAFALIAEQNAKINKNGKGSGEARGRDTVKACGDGARGESGEIKREETVIIGDSLTSDILGGIRAGLHTVHVDRSGKYEYTEIKPEFSVKALREIGEILEKIQ